MSSAFQTFAALALVAVAAAWLVRRAFTRRKHSGCSGGCPAAETNSKLAKLARRASD